MILRKQLWAVCPADWAETLRPSIFGADIARDPRARFEAALSTITDRTMKQLEHSVGHPIRGTDSDWRDIATHIATDVLITRVGPTTRQLEIARWIKGYTGAAETKYIILDATGVPLQRTADSKMAISEPMLPLSRRMWLESHTAE
jgi:hypothetical protein